MKDTWKVQPTDWGKADPKNFISNLQIYQIFIKIVFIKINLFVNFSTSQVASSYEAFMCYGPLTYDGYGCCYSPRNNDIYFGLSSMRSNNDTSTAKFRKSLQEALQLMQQLLQTVGEQPIKSKL